MGNFEEKSRYWQVGRILDMASVSFSVQAQVAKRLDQFGKKHKLGSRTQIIDYLLNSKKPEKSLIYFDQNGEPINEFLEYLNSNENKPN